MSSEVALLLCWNCLPKHSISLARQAEIQTYFDVEDGEVKEEEKFSPMHLVVPPFLLPT